VLVGVAGAVCETVTVETDANANGANRSSRMLEGRRYIAKLERYIAEYMYALMNENGWWKDVVSTFY
jgi:hypothetical protein